MEYQNATEQTSKEATEEAKERSRTGAGR